MVIPADCNDPEVHEGRQPFLSVHGHLADNQIPSIQTNKPVATLIPLMFVISLGILKEAIAKIKRW